MVFGHFISNRYLWKFEKMAGRSETINKNNLMPDFLPIYPA